MIAVLDAGPLYASIDTSDVDHDRCVAVLERSDLNLIVPVLVVAEVTYFVGRRLGPAAEASFLRGLSSLEVEAPSVEDWSKIAKLVAQYGDFPLGGADASVAVLAERLGTDLIVTLDRRHFAALRMKDGRGFTLIPD